MKPSFDRRFKLALVLVMVAAATAVGWAVLSSPPPVPEKTEAPVVLAPVARPTPGPVVAPEARRTVSPAPAPSAVDPMERLRAIVDSEPVAALALAREEAQREPDGPFADERSFRMMQALVHLGQIVEARNEATEFFRVHPESPWGERVERLTGVHPRRYYQNGR